MSSQTARMAALESMGASRGESDVLIDFDLTIPICRCQSQSANASLLRPREYASSFCGFPALLGGKIKTGDPHGHDDARGGPAWGLARGDLGQAERPRGAQGLHSRVRGIGTNRG